MALSMDEQRVLAEIERRLAAEDPGLAARLSAFRRPGPGSLMRSPRARIAGSVLTVALVAVISLMVYAMIGLRAHPDRILNRPQSSPATPVLTVPGGKAPPLKLPGGRQATNASAVAHGPKVQVHP
jgi:hypothetical protein